MALVALVRSVHRRAAGGDGRHLPHRDAHRGGVGGRDAAARRGRRARARDPRQRRSGAQPSRAPVPRPQLRRSAGLEPDPRARRAIRRGGAATARRSHRRLRQRRGRRARRDVVVTATSATEPVLRGAWLAARRPRQRGRRLCRRLARARRRRHAQRRLRRLARGGGGRVGRRDPVEVRGLCRARRALRRHGGAARRGDHRVQVAGPGGRGRGGGQPGVERTCERAGVYVCCFCAPTQREVADGRGHPDGWAAALHRRVRDAARACTRGEGHGRPRTRPCSARSKHVDEFTSRSFDS